MHGNREQVLVGAKLSNASDKFSETLINIVDNDLHCQKRVQGSFSWCISALPISITLPVSHSHVPMGLHSQQPAPRCLCPKEAGNICEFSHSPSPNTFGYPGSCTRDETVQRYLELPCEAEPK